MIKNLFSIFFTLLTLISISAQVHVTGKIIDSETNDPIPNVDIFLKGTQTYTSSAKDGSFSIQSDKFIDSLQIDADNYPLKYISLNPGDNLDITVKVSKTGNNKNKTKTIKDIVITGFPPKKVKKKENPAYYILRELWKRKRTNGLTNFDNYQYKEYEKIEFDLNNIDSAFISKKIFKKLNITTKDIDTLDISGKTYLPVFLNESITDVIGQNKPSRREKELLRANKVYGIPGNDIIANTVKNLYKEINIYDNTLNFFNKGFTSPVATDGFAIYEYLLLDSISVKNGVTCYHIKYRPLRKNELTFKGDLFITKGTYNVKEATLQASEGINVNFVKDIYMELEYDMANDSVFIPVRNYTLLDMSLLTKKESSKGMFAKRTLTYEDYKFNEPEKQVAALLDQQWEPISEGAYNKDSEYWSQNRPSRLQDDDKKAEKIIDAVTQTKTYKHIVDGVQILSSGYINVAHSIDIGDLYQTFGFNNIEGFRLRAGARTYFTPNDMWRLEGYTAYGFKDHQFKYGGQARFMLNKFNRLTLGIGTKRDVAQLGASLTTDEGIMTRSFASSSIISKGDNDYLSSVNQTSAFVAINPWKNVTFRLDGAYQYIKSADTHYFNIGYYDRKGNIKEELYNTYISFSVQAKPGAKYSRYGLDRYEHTTLAPTILIKYTKGLNGVLNSSFNYDKLQLFYAQPILWGPIGKTNITLELGKVFNRLPLSLLSVIPANQSYGIIPNTFALLNYYDFVTDTYGTFNMEHHFNGRLFSYIPLLKKLQLREVVFFRGALGNISDGSKAMNASNIFYTAPNKDIYYEYGFGIENIGWGNLRFFRVDFNWRGNYFDIPSSNKINKFGVKVGMQFTF